MQSELGTCAWRQTRAAASYEIKEEDKGYIDTPLSRFLLDLLHIFPQSCRFLSSCAVRRQLLLHDVCEALKLIWWTGPKEQKEGTVLRRREYEGVCVQGKP
ncbi:hypothetical protein EYF80_017206 [Liparis tanakae]|uniref:Uncharacterized protein n=1 Tax=Liparis tanakae TaxID=230148 RepID=A0A4Z2I3F6_9TELE|nr:hypothetical protein EYF80_017206 [Liparis tanakae]